MQRPAKLSTLGRFRPPASRSHHENRTPRRHPTASAAFGNLRAAGGGEAADEHEREPLPIGRAGIALDHEPDLIGDPTRRCVLASLAVEGEICVCEFVAALKEVQPSVSRHLALLRDGGWITSRREGTWMHYRLARLPKWARTLLDALVSGGVPPEVLRNARNRLAAFPGRPPRAIERVA